MSNPDHVTRAGYAIGVWNRWRDEHPEIQPDLSGANLSAGLYRKGKLFGANLSGVDLRRSNLREADFHDSNLAKADLSKTDLRAANLSNADLTGAELAKANLTGAVLRGANLTDVDLEKAHLSEVDFTDVTLHGAKLWKADLQTTTGLTQEQIDGAQGDKTTQLPAGLKRPAHWASAQKTQQ